MKQESPCHQEFDFALIVDAEGGLTDVVADALFTAGCDDATAGMRYGCLYLEFSRAAASIEEAILTAIRDVRKAGLSVTRVDDCNLVTQSEIARRIGRSRQLVNQYITAKRGPGGFPAPDCYLATDAPLWSWCAISQWLVKNDMIRPSQLRTAEVIHAINTSIEWTRQQDRDPALVTEITEALLK